MKTLTTKQMPWVLLIIGWMIIGFETAVNEHTLLPLLFFVPATIISGQNLRKLGGWKGLKEEVNYFYLKLSKKG